MSTRIATIIDDVIRREGGYVNHPADRGGPTRFGITTATARREGYHGDMRELPRELAMRIYWRRYVTDPGFDRLVSVDEAVAEECIDTGVLMGPARAAMFLQRWLNALNSAGRYEDLFVDGRCGDATAGALRDFIAWRGAAGARALVVALNCSQGDRFLDIAEADPQQRAFTYGWLTHRVVDQLA